MSEAPLGDLAVESEVWPPDRLRQFEDRALRRGMRVLTTVALAGDATLVGNTVLVVDRTLRRGIDQSGTLVLPEHRGHRLGLAMKLANQRQLQRDHRVPALVHTYNAEENGPMIAVNRRLGFQPVELTDEWQRRAGERLTVSSSRSGSPRCPRAPAVGAAAPGPRPLAARSA